MVKKEFFSAVQAMVQAAGLKLAAVTPRPFAVAAGLTQTLAAGKAPPLESPDAAAAVVTLSPQGGEFTVVRHGKVTFKGTRIFVADVLADLENGLSWDFIIRRWGAGKLSKAAIAEALHLGHSAWLDEDGRLTRAA